MHESLQDYSESSPSLSSSSVSSDQKWVWLWPITYLFNIIGDCKARQLCRDSYKFVLTPIQTVKIPQTRQDSFTMSFWELRHWFAATTQLSYVSPRCCWYLWGSVGAVCLVHSLLFPHSMDVHTDVLKGLFRHTWRGWILIVQPPG